MGRGDNNLLFSPHLLKQDRRAKPKPYPGQSGTLLVGVRELLLKEEMTLLRDERQGLFPLEKDFTLAAHGPLPPRIAPEAQIAMSKSKFVWGDADGFVIKDLSGGAFYKDSLPGPLQGIYINEEQIFAAALDTKHPGSSNIYVSSANNESDWQELAGYSYGQASIVERGDHALILYEETYNKIPAFATLSPSGLDQMVFLPLGFSERSDPEKLLTAISPNNCLAVAENEEGEPELRHLFLKPSLASGSASDNFVASLTQKNGVKSTTFKGIASSGGRVVILGNRELILADPTGLLSLIPLGKNGDYWDQVSFLGDRALLWKRDGDLYQEFFLP